MDELIDVLDEQGQKTGVVSKRFDAHVEGLWHRTVHVWIVSPYKDVVFQKRKDSHYLGQDLLDASVVGHIQAGQESVESAIRECFEELALTVSGEDLNFLLTDKLSTIGATKNTPCYINNEFRDIYVLKTEFNLFDFKFDTQEMKGLELVTLEEFGKMVSERDKRLVPQWQEYEALLWYLGEK
jgi:isopentenyldiphosphate isomerase